MADLSVQKFSTVGLNPTFGAADSAGDTYTNAGTTYLFVKNGGTAAIDVTIDSIKPCDQGHDHDIIVSVAAGATAQLGPYDYIRFNNDLKKVSVSYSAVTSVQVAAVRV